MNVLLLHLDGNLPNLALNRIVELRKVMQPWAHGVQEVE